MSSLRVLMTPDTVGGVWTYAVDLIAALAAHDVHVVLATLGGPMSLAQRRQTDTLTNVSVFESQYKLEWMDDPWADVEASGQWLLEMEALFRPDVVHLNGYAHGRQPFAAPVLTVAHSCCLSWWSAVKGEQPPGHWDRYREEVAAGLAGADLVVAPTQAMLMEIERWYAPPSPTRVIHNGREHTAFAASEKQPFVFAAGRLWDEAKNIATLAQIAGDLPWPIVVAGNARCPDGRQVDPRDLHLLGVLSEADVARQMSRASIYVMPAKYEPFGLSILEAAFAGCALVLGDIPSLREVWADAAIYVDPRRPSQLRDALNELIANPQLRADFTARAARRAARYTASAMAGAYLDAYRELITGTAGQRPSARAAAYVKETVA